MTTIVIAMAGLGLALLAASFAQVRIGLRPLGKLRHEIAAVRDGRAATLPHRQPREIEPLVDELDALLAQNAANLERARGHVANLAHGLKTPLATLALSLQRVPGDHGPGLDPAEIARVMRPGQRLDEDDPGHGFGLPIARELVELYGGSLSLAPRERGLFVTVRAPAAR